MPRQRAVPMNGLAFAKAPFAPPSAARVRTASVRTAPGWSAAAIPGRLRKARRCTRERALPRRGVAELWTL